uniref:Chorein N-terminal domain-containing protein n=1 Tax=Solanum lycopersicum TaxID=4081 RepID=A0A3Q7HU91_SOLLC
MLEDQVAYLLQRYLGNYVIGLNKEALKISVWQDQHQCRIPAPCSSNRGSTRTKMHIKHLYVLDITVSGTDEGSLGERSSSFQQGLTRKMVIETLDEQTLNEGRWNLLWDSAICV